MIQLKLSETGPVEAFTAAVQTHRDAVEKHMLGKPGIHAPRSSGLVESLVKRVPASGPVDKRGPDTIVIEPYEIVDDTPAPPAAPVLTLEQRQHELLFNIQAAAGAAKAAILSPARVQLLVMNVMAANAKPEAARTPSEVAQIAAYTAYAERVAEIDRAVVLAAIEIEDLTDLTISGWNPPTF